MAETINITDFPACEDCLRNEYQAGMTPNILETAGSYLVSVAGETARDPKPLELTEEQRYMIAARYYQKAERAFHREVSVGNICYLAATGNCGFRIGDGQCSDWHYDTRIHNVVAGSKAETLDAESVQA